MGRRLLDTYEKWVQQGVHKKKLKDIKDLVAKGVTQKKTAELLGITEKTLIKLKRNHKEVERAFIFGNDKLIDDAFGSVYKKAMGFKVPLKTIHAEENKNGKGQKKNKVTITERYFPPDLPSLKYWLIIKGGKEYNERREELDLMKERLNKRDEEWNDASNS